MRLRNNIFAAAFDYLKRDKGIKTQKKLAELMGVSEDTITRILKDRTEVTEDIITKLQTASGCIFNLQWLRGEDQFHMLAEDLIEDQQQAHHTTPCDIDQSSLVNVALSSQMEQIVSLKQNIEDLKQTIEDMKAQHLRELAAKDEIIEKSDKIAEERLHRIAELRRIIDANHYGLEHLPFPHGVADNPNDLERARK